MKRYLINIIIVAYLSVGCGTTYEIGEPSGKLSYEEVREKLIGEEVKVELDNGTSRKGTFRGFTIDGIVLQSDTLSPPDSFPLSSITSVATLPPTKAYFIGGGIGFAFGGAAGCLIGGATLPKGDVDQNVNQAAYAGLAGGAIGCLAGVGAVASSGDTYKFTLGQAIPDSVVSGAEELEGPESEDSPFERWISGGLLGCLWR